ncbi:ADP-ribosylglycohydrolase family protein [Microbulbifer sp. CNSA002]|uniref:ADP-ribosylglycohydrolase family protein n=1 Tax=unclassified Microbulbifer TaxID=2619833 RepID=UPI0039B4F0F9
MEDRIIGSLVGLACGDAVGTTLEFEVRGTFEPIKDMVGGGPFRLQRGEWTDDTSMALCLAHSLLSKLDFDPEDQMNRYCNWYQYGYMSSNGRCFDIGITVSKSLEQYLQTRDPFSGSIDIRSSGNGSLMRLAPIPIFFSKSEELCIKYAGESSRTTHGSYLCISSCRMLSLLIYRAFRAGSKDEVFDGLDPTDYCEELRSLTNKDFSALGYKEINGSGYVIESLIAAAWCFYHGKSFRECILLAANLGNDADTTAAICGQMAGAFYGYSNIPVNWREEIVMSAEIRQLAIDLYHAGRTI